MTDSKQILDNLSQLMKTIPQNPIVKLDEVNTIIQSPLEEIIKKNEGKKIW